MECPSEIRHWALHHWVPTSNQNNAPVSWTLNCTTHTYYSSSNYTISFIYNNWWITSCPPWERVVWWNWSNTITCQKYDDTPPSPSDITSSQISGWYFRATNSFPINVTWNASGWSPITLIQWQFENLSNHLSFNSIRSTNSNILSGTENISIVDGLDRNSNNYREYSYIITNICDEAGNCTTTPVTFNYNVYAWHINNSQSSTSWVSSLTSSNLADGTQKTLTFSLRDEYLNKVVPVYQSNWTTLIRSITLTSNYNNSLYLNQYNKTWAWVEVSGFDDSVYSNSLIWNSQTKSTTVNNKANNDWDYNLNFKVYSPTYNSSASNWQQFVDWNFRINNVTATLTDSYSWVLPDTSNIDFQFKPLYTTDITWSIIANNKFIVGTTQTWTISVTSWWSKNVYLEFWYYDSSSSPTHKVHPKLNLQFTNSSSTNYNDVKEWKQSSILSLSYFWNSTSNLFTKLTQSGTLDTAEQNTYLATHIQTTVLWKTVVYSSDIFWMNRYAWANTWDNTSQRWVKILWITHSQNQVDLVSWQSSSNWASSNDISLLWNLEKSYLQRDVRENSYSLTKKVSTNNWNKLITNLNQSSPWVRLWDVLYFWNLEWENVTINLSWTYSWVKTILVQWWNVYIKQNILAANKATDILWIIALKDDTTWKGWNIYINPTVSEINAVLYADRAFASADDITILRSTDLDRAISPDNGWTYEYLNRQLYIYWTVFSNNTIGWSVQTPYLCPFYISNCTLDNAQKYDMNYLRRGYDNKRDSSYENYPVIINYNSLIQLTPPPLFQKK